MDVKKADAKTKTVDRNGAWIFAYCLASYGLMGLWLRWGMADDFRQFSKGRYDTDTIFLGILFTLSPVSLPVCAIIYGVWWFFWLIGKMLYAIGGLF